MTAAALPLRRTWIAEQLTRRDNTFARLLRQLVPGARVEPGDPLNAYYALFDHIQTLFPVYDPDTDWWGEQAAEVADEEGGEPDLLNPAEYEGIPVRVLGLCEYDVTHGHCAPALALAYYLCNDWYQIAPPALRAIPELAPVLARRLCLAPSAVNAPRNRQWVGLWKNLPDLFAYVKHATGCSMLDYSSEDFENGMENPEWDIDEIRGLAHDWQQGEPLLKRVNALAAYIGQDQARLLDLGLLLTGDPDVRQRLSTPKRPGKTLAQIFAGGRHA